MTKKEKPSFYLNCRNSKRKWKDDKFGGEMLFLCLRANLKPCDKKICIRLIKKIKQSPEKDESRIIELPQLQKHKGYSDQ